LPKLFDWSADQDRTPCLFGQVYHFTWQKGGSDTLLTEFTGDEALIEEQFAKSHHLEIGDHFKVTSIEGTTLDLKVFGQYKDPTLMTGFTIPSVTFDRFTTNVDPGVLLVKFRSGVSVDAGKAAVAKALKAFPIAKVRTNAEYKAYTEKQVNGFLSFLYVLLAMSLIISLFGIVNTLVLTIFERTRELGMLRAVGMTRWQVRFMIALESVVTALIGAAIGITLGIVLAVLLIIRVDFLVLSWPIGSLLIFALVAMVAGVVAAIFPAQRAARLNVLEALQYE
jgi:putative ABC transport system permease protein